jgi:hypothetical protein
MSFLSFRNGGERGIGFASQNRYAITFGAPSPLRSVETSHPSFAALIV